MPDQGLLKCDSDWFQKGEKTSPELESLTWPYAEPTTLAFFSWQMLMVRCLTLCSSPVLEALGKRGGLLASYSLLTHLQTTICSMSDAPLSSDLRGRYQSSWTWLKAPQGHHQWPPPPSCPWPITQNITINSCPGAKYHRHSRAYSYMLCTDSPCKDSFVRGQKVELVEREKHPGL